MHRQHARDTRNRRNAMLCGSGWARYGREEVGPGARRNFKERSPMEVLRRMRPATAARPTSHIVTLSHPWTCVLFFSVALQHTPYVTCVVEHHTGFTASAVSAVHLRCLGSPCPIRNVTAIWLQFGSNLTWGARDPRPRHRNMVVFC